MLPLVWNLTKLFSLASYGTRESFGKGDKSVVFLKS